jgi:2'-5' RNA ligase
MNSNDRMRDHWWWRLGWRLGRRMYTWHITFDGQRDLYDLVDGYGERLAGIPGLDPIPHQWLHLTTQGLGFVDEVPEPEVDAVIAAVGERLAKIQPPSITIGPAIVDPEVVRLKVQPVDDLIPIRRALRDAIVAVRGTDLLMESEEWTPHISVAYSSAEGPMEPISAAIRSELPPVAATVSEVQLIVLGRDNKMYEWETRAALPLGG